MLTKSKKVFFDKNRFKYFIRMKNIMKSGKKVTNIIYKELTVTLYTMKNI